MDGRELKEIWRSGTPSFGAWITSTDPSIAAVTCNIGYEWVLIETEHSAYNPETLRNILAVVRARAVVPIVRVRDNDASLIKQALDFGGEGVMVPLLRTAQEAREAVAACRYPPHGIRGFSPGDVTNYYHDLDHYLRTINERVIVMLQVENADAVSNVDAFLALPGTDCILIGPADLSFSLGVPLQMHHPKMEAAIDTVIAKCNAAVIPVGIAMDGTAEDQIEWVNRGVNFLLVGDALTWMIQSGGAMLSRLREETGGR